MLKHCWLVANTTESSFEVYESLTEEPWGLSDLQSTDTDDFRFKRPLCRWGDPCACANQRGKIGRQGKSETRFPSGKHLYLKPTTAGSSPKNRSFSHPGMR